MRALRIACLALLLAIPAPPMPAQLIPLGEVFAVNQDPAGDQRRPALAATENGGFVVVWGVAEGGAEGIEGRRLGQVLDGSFVVETSTLMARSVAVATYDSGFVVAWLENDVWDRIRGRRFNPFANPLADLEPWSTAAYFGSGLGLEAFADGSLVLSIDAWGGTFTHLEVAVREVSPESVVTGEATVNQDGYPFSVIGPQSNPVVATAPSGRYTVAWQEDEVAIDARRLGQGVQPLADQFRVAGPAPMAPSTSSTFRPAVAADAAGNFLVVWEGGPESGDTDVWARRYAVSGEPLGEAFRVHSEDSRDQRLPDVAMDLKGNAVVVWRDESVSGEVTIRGRLLNRFDEPQGEELEIDSAIPAESCNPVYLGHCAPKVALTESDRVLVVWDDPGIDGDERGIAGRFLDAIFDTDCRPDSRTLCLNRDRFEVKVDWRDFAGNVGTAFVAPAASEGSGIFWFFSAANWEILVKVLDGCGINDHYWVFAAATTDVEYTLTVTDTLSRVSVDYINPLGTAAPSITGTTAFATCP